MRKSSVKQATGLVGAIALTSFVGLPALAQMQTPTNPAGTEATPGMMTPGNNTMPEMMNTPSQRTTPGTVNTPSQSNSSQRRTSTAAALDREFLIMAAQGNNAEILTSQLARQKSRNQSVLQFADRMIQEHTAANQQLETLARQYGVTLPRDAGPLDNAVARRLNELSGSEFDRAYMDAQVASHMKSVALYNTQVQLGQAQDVKTFASRLLPNIRGHYEMASQMSPNRNAIDVRPGQRTPNDLIR